MNAHAYMYSLSACAGGSVEALGVVYADVSHAHSMVMVVGVNELAIADGGILKELWITFLL